MIRSIILPCILFSFKSGNQEKFVPFSFQIRLHFRAIVTLIIMTFAVMPTHAQWGFAPLSFHPSELHDLPGKSHFSRPPSTLQYLLKRLQQVHSQNFGVSIILVYEPGFHHLYSQHYGVNSNLHYFGLTDIEFISCSSQNNGAGSWRRGKIFGFTNSFGIAHPLPTPLFQPNNQKAPDVQGGIERSTLVIRPLWENPTEIMATEADFSPFTDGVVLGNNPSTIDMSDCTIMFNFGTTSRMQQNAAISRTKVISGANGGKITFGIRTVSGVRHVDTSACSELSAMKEPSIWSLNSTNFGDHDYFGVKNNNPFIIKTTNEHHMHIAIKGDVHLGTLQWDYTATAGNHYRTAYPSLLSVNGAVVAKVVRVTVNNWADNVFSPSYRLMPLSEVKEFITKNGHLPDVPAEADATKNGVDLLEMQAILLRKVEELTLHLIKIEEENSKLRSHVEVINASLPMEGE